MLTNNPNITSLAYDAKSKEQVNEMTFKDYVIESGSQIIPPSGQSITPTGSSSMPGNKNNSKMVWPGNGAPVQQGMTVGIKGPKGISVPGEVSQVDQNANGVKVINPTTGQQEWHNNSELQPIMSNGNTVETTQEDTDLIRLRELAGLGNIKENCSSGATGAGAIAIAPSSQKKMARREYTQEAMPVEYTPKKPAETIIGDTKPNQATGKLSADLAARGKRTASRTNNGFKK